MEETYTQCFLTKGDLSQTTWIPSQYAQIGKVVDLKEKDTWSRGWTVESTYTTASKEYVEDRKLDYRKFRSATDI